MGEIYDKGRKLRDTILKIPRATFHNGCVRDGIIASYSLFEMIYLPIRLCLVRAQKFH